MVLLSCCFLVMSQPRQGFGLKKRPKTKTNNHTTVLVLCPPRPKIKACQMKIKCLSCQMKTQTNKTSHQRCKITGRCVDNRFQFLPQQWESAKRESAKRGNLESLGFGHSKGYSKVVVAHFWGGFVGKLGFCEPRTFVV